MKLAIKGHATRGEEIIEILEMLGGENKYNIVTLEENLLYTIRTGDNAIIATYPNNSISSIFTLEEFLEKYPYKVGDKVSAFGNKWAVINAVWDGSIDEVVYTISSYTSEYITTKLSNQLQPYEEVAIYLNKKTNKRTEEIVQVIKSAKEIMGEGKYSELRMPLDDYDKLATEVTIDGGKITPPKNHLIGKITKVDNGMLVEFVKQNQQYPKSYGMCCMVLGLDDFTIKLQLHCAKHGEGELYRKFIELKRCRDAYWKIAGEEMRLGAPWEPYWNNDNQFKYIISCRRDKIIKDTNTAKNSILAFPTEKIRDAFYENFKDLIEECKDFL